MRGTRQQAADLSQIVCLGRAVEGSRTRRTPAANITSAVSATPRTTRAASRR